MGYLTDFLPIYLTNISREKPFQDQNLENVSNSLRSVKIEECVPPMEKHIKSGSAMVKRGAYSAEKIVS